MNKKVLKQMFADIASKDQIRPMLMGVHFEADRCYAADTHMVVVYNQGSPKLDGKTVLADGTEITRAGEKGERLPVVYPNIDRVIPQPNEEFLTDLDLRQLLEAMKFHKKDKSAHKDDKIAFGESIFTIDYLTKILNLYQVAGELSKCKFYLNIDKSRPLLMVSDSLTALLMPNAGEGLDIDGERIPDCAMILSYETIVNNYAFNGWRKEEKPMDLAWLD